jgi:hypothetical protein
MMTIESSAYPRSTPQGWLESTPTCSNGRYRTTTSRARSRVARTTISPSCPPPEWVNLAERPPGWPLPVRTHALLCVNLRDRTEGGIP